MLQYLKHESAARSGAFCNYYSSPLKSPDFVLPTLPCPRFSRVPRSNRCGCGHVSICHKILNILMLPTHEARVAAFSALEGSGIRVARRHDVSRGREENE